MAVIVWIEMAPCNHIKKIICRLYCGSGHGSSIEYTILSFSNLTFKHLINYCNMTIAELCLDSHTRNKITKQEWHSMHLLHHVTCVPQVSTRYTWHCISSQVQHEPWIVWGCLQDMMENPGLRGCVPFSMTQRSSMCYLLKTKGSLHTGCKSQRSFQLESSENSAFHIHHHLTIMVHQWLVHTTRPKAWETWWALNCWASGIEKLHRLCGKQFAESWGLIKILILSIIIKKYQGYITESTSQSQGRYFSFSTAYRSALAGFGKEVFGKGSPDCSSLSVSVASLPVCMCWNHPLQKRQKASNLT